MTETAVQSRYSDILARIRQPARLVGNESGAGEGFSDDKNELRVVLAFPDVYEIGISNQAIQVLYHLARRAEGVAVERTYVPWVDASEEMRRDRVPLLTLETWSPVVSADLLGITLQHEFNYTNVLELLDLAGIPLLSGDRGEEHPIVVGGGPAVADFLPVAPFFDAVAVGDGEETLLEILAILVAAKLEGADRTERKRRLSLVEGVFVPGVSSTVKRRVLRRLEDAPYPASCLVPLAAGVHDRAWVEVMRGCSRGCRFCQAGMWYRPVRERSSHQVMAMVEDQLAATGHQELALASLSTTDYSALTSVLASMALEHPETRVSLPSLRVDSAAVRLAHLVSPTGPALTLAPEAGNARMWDIINKNVTEEEVLSAAEEAFRCGYTSLKLYFIIGLPLETDEDVEAIASLCLRIRELGRAVLGQNAGRLQLSISINNFVPKPFTPFQRVGMADRATIRRRQEILRARLRRRGIRVALHDVDKSFLEATLARGGEEMASVILEAWRRGARFDSWTEEFRAPAWREALEVIGTIAEESATTPLSAEDDLPWYVVTGTVSDDFLQQEYERATRGEKTVDCRDGDCSACGVCRDDVTVDLAAGGSNFANGISALAETEHGVRRRPAAASEGAGHRYLLTFAVRGKMRFIGHLDKVETFRRAVRRAGGRLALSAGLRPKPLLSLALPLGVGFEAQAELCEFGLATPAPADFLNRLRAALPAGLDVVSFEPYGERRHAAARVIGAEYEIEVEATAPEIVPDLAGSLREAADRYVAASTLLVRERRQDRVRDVDVKAFVNRVDVVDRGSGVALLRFQASVTPAGSARPERVVEAMADLAGVALRLRRGMRKSILLS